MATTLSAVPAIERRVTAEWLPGALLSVLAAGFMTMLMLAAGMAPGYDVHGGAISDLGVIAETAWLFNASLILVGVLNLSAGVLLFRSHRRGWLLGLFTVAGLGAVGVGLVPLDKGDLHSVFALVAFLFFNLEAIGCALLVKGPMRWLSVICGIVGLVFVAVMAVGDSGDEAVFGAIGHGGAERMIVYPVMIWMLAFGGFLMATPIRNRAAGNEVTASSAARSPG